VAMIVRQSALAEYFGIRRVVPIRIEEAMCGIKMLLSVYGYFFTHEIITLCLTLLLTV
jgi:hypothetical protein